MLFRPCGKPDGAGRRNAFNAGPVLHQPEDFIPGQHHVTMKHPHDAGDGIGGEERTVPDDGPRHLSHMENNPRNVYVSGLTASITLFYPSSRNASGTARSGQILYMNRRKAVFSIPGNRYSMDCTTNPQASTILLSWDSGCRRAHHAYSRKSTAVPAETNRDSFNRGG